MRAETALTILAGALLLAATPASPRTWYVKPDSTGDAPTIQAAIDSASPGDSVLLANGTYLGDRNRDIEFRGKRVTVRSESGDPQLCIINCREPDHHAGRGFLFSSGEGPESILEGVTVTLGYRGMGGYGGGILCSGSSPTIRKVRLLNNTASGGGGMACEYGAHPCLSDVTFLSNYAEGLSGGGLLCRGESSPTLTDVVFALNNAGFLGFGGGLSCIEGSSPVLNGVTFQENFGDVGGGGIYCSGSSPSLTSVGFYGNRSSGTTPPAHGGGGMLCANGSAAVLTHCTFTDNGAITSGGGLWCNTGSDAMLTYTSFYRNSAEYGGGVNCDDSSPTLVNCTLFGNAATVAGGGVFCWRASPTVQNTIIASSA